MLGLFKRPPYVSRRVDRAMVAAACAGAVVGLVVGYGRFWFLDLWLGAVVGGPIGLALGITWEKARGGSEVNWRHAGLAAIGSVLLAGIAVFFIVPMTVTARRNVETLTTLAPESLVEIRVCKRYSDQELAVIDDRAALTAFAADAADAKVHYSGQDGSERVDAWWLTLVFAGGHTQRVEWQQRSAQPSLVYGRFIETTPASLAGRGGFVSTKLRGWFARHVEPKLEK